MNKYLSDPGVKALIERTKSGDNKAWEELYENYKKYIHECCWKKLRKLEMTDSLKNEIETFRSNNEKTEKLHTILISIAILLSLVSCCLPFVH